MNKKQVALGIAVLAISIALGVYAKYRIREVTSFMGLIPASLEIQRTVIIDGKTGFIEGCGAAVFELSPATLRQIQLRGLAALKDAHQARDYGDELHRYSQWKETPYIETGDGMSLVDRWLAGRSCAKFDLAVDRGIETALKSPGSYYATIHEAGLIVIPKLKLVVYSYFG
jgi:hypothetical protein